MLDDAVDQSVLLSLFGIQVMIPLDVSAQGLFRLTGALVQELDLGIAEALALFRLNLERGDITFCFPDGLVEHQGGEFVGGALSCTGGKNFAGAR